MKLICPGNKTISIITCCITVIYSLLHAQPDTSEQTINDTVPLIKNAVSSVATISENDDTGSFFKCKFTTFILPVAFSIRPAGFTSFNSIAGLNLCYKRVFGDISFEWDWAGDAFNFDANEKVTIVKNKSIETFFRSFEIGAGWTFYSKSTVSKNRTNFYQVHGGFKSLSIPQVALRSDSLTQNLQPSQMYGKDTAVTLNTREALFFLGPELYFIKKAGRQIRTLNLYTDLLSAPFINYTPTGNDGKEYKDTLCALQKKEFGVRVGLKVSISFILTKFSHRLQTGVYGQVETGIYPGIHYADASLMYAMENNVKYLLYDICGNAGIGVYCMF